MDMVERWDSGITLSTSSNERTAKSVSSECSNVNTIIITFYRFLLQEDIMSLAIL